MNTNVTQIAEFIRASLGQAWWDAHVKVAITNAFIGLGCGLLLLLLIPITIRLTIGWYHRHEDVTDSEAIFLFGGFGWFFGGVIAVMLIVTSLTTLASPDLKVWDDLVKYVSAMLS